MEHAYPIGTTAISIDYRTPATDYTQRSAAWEAEQPLTLYTMTKLELAFTLANSGYTVRVIRGSGQQTVSNTYNNASKTGEVRIELSKAGYWANATSGSFRVRFFRPATNGQTYSNIRLIVTYEQIAIPSTIAVQPAVAGQPQTVNITNTDATVWHRVSWNYGTVTSGLLTFGAATRSPAWAVPAEDLPALYALHKNTDRIPGTVICDTYAGNGVLVGSRGAQTYLTIPETEATRPTLDVELTSVQDEIGASAGVDWLQNHTQLVITPTAAAQAGAGLAGIQITTPDGSYTVASGASKNILLTALGEYPIRVTATDTRGYTASWSGSIVVTGCSAPAIVGLTAYRCTGQGEATEDGSYIRVEAVGTWSAIATSVTWVYELMRVGTSTVLESGALHKGAGIVGGALDAETGYTVRVTLGDSLGQSATASIDVGTALYTIFRMKGGRGVAFGQIADKYGVEVRADWPMYVHGEEILRLLVDTAHPPGSRLDTIDEGYNPNTVWPWTRWARSETGWIRVMETAPDMELPSRMAILGEGRLGLLVLGHTSD